MLARGSAPPLYAAHSGGWVTPGVLRQVLRSRVSGFNRNTFTVTLELALARSLTSFTTYQGSTAPGESCLRERKRMQSLLSSAEAEKDWPSARALSLLREPRTWHKRRQGGQPREEDLGLLPFSSSHCNLDLRPVSFVLGRRVILNS